MNAVPTTPTKAVMTFELSHVLSGEEASPGGLRIASIFAIRRSCSSSASGVIGAYCLTVDSFSTSCCMPVLAGTGST
jgi:hypothetical protein